MLLLNFCSISIPISQELVMDFMTLKIQFSTFFGIGVQQSKRVSEAIEEMS